MYFNTTLSRSCIDPLICIFCLQITQDGKIADLQKERNRLREDLCTMEARLKNGGGSSGSSSANDEKLRVLTQQLDTLNHTVKQAQVKLKEAQSELTSKTKAIESSHLLNKKLDKEVQQLKDEVRLEQYMVWRLCVAVFFVIFVFCTFIMCFPRLCYVHKIKIVFNEMLNFFFLMRHSKANLLCSNIFCL